MSGLTSVVPVHADLNKVPRGDDGNAATVVMTLTDGKVVWQRNLIRAKRRPEIDPATGEQKWQLHPTTAQPLYPRFTLERNEIKQVFTLESDGHANLYVQDYTPPTPEEERRMEMESRANEFKDDLARLAAENGVSAGDLLARIMASTATEPAADEYPRKAAGVGMWELSNGSKVRGSREDAVKAEAGLLPPPE